MRSELVAALAESSASDCPNREGALCKMAQVICEGCDAQIVDVSVCEFCVERSGAPYSINKATVSIAYRASNEEGKKQVLADYGRFLKQHTAGRADRTNPGDRLTEIIAWFGDLKSQSCDCTRHAEQMNILGLKWCEVNRSKILSWLMKEFDKRKLSDFLPPGFKWTGYLVTKKGARWVAQRGAEWAVDLALQRARARWNGHTE